MTDPQQSRHKSTSRFHRPPSRYTIPYRFNSSTVISFFAGIPSFPDAFCCAATRRDFLPFDSPLLFISLYLVLRSLLTAIAQNKTDKLQTLRAR